MSTPILTTGRLILRPPVAEYAQAIADILNDWEVTQWLTMVPFPYALADAQEFLAHLFAGESRNYWLIEAEGKVIGAISLRPDLGFFLTPEAHGRGYMTDGARAVLGWHFGNSDEDAFSGYHVGNAASARVQEKLGFRPTHEVIDRKVSTGENVTVNKTALTRADWEATHV